MCGYLGYFSNYVGEETVEIAQKAFRTLLPRGRTSQNFVVNEDDHTILAHTRLKITGEFGTQPLTSQDGLVSVMVNGQFYNEDLLMLFSSQNLFQTDCDSELALVLYEQEGVEGLKKLNGEFSLCLFDREKQLVILMRDQAGVKPLKYMIDGPTLVVSSEAKAILPFQAHNRFDAVSLLQALSVQYVDPKRTLFEGISQVPPGTIMCCQKKDDDQWFVEAEQWFKWFDPNVAIDPPTHSTLSELRNSVRLRMHPTLPMALHLSGGVDSTVIATLAQEFKQDLSLSQDLEAFTVSFEESHLNHNEVEVARQTSIQLGLPLHEVFVAQDDVYHKWQQQCFVTEGFGINGHFVAKQMLSERIHQEGYRVLLSGEGADEALLGYSFFNPKSLTNPETSSLSAIKMIEGSMLPHGEELPHDVFLEHWGRVPLWLRAKLSLGAKLTSLLKPSMQEQVKDAMERWAISNQDVFATPMLSVHQDAASWAHVALGNYILPSLADTPESNQSIQGRTPYLDPLFLRHCFSLSPEQAGLSKHSARNKKPLRDYLDEQNIQHVSLRPKQPFQAPPLLSSRLVKRSIVSQWQKEDVWDNTPFCPQKMRAFAFSLEQSNPQDDVIWDPVVCTILSVLSFNTVFKLSNFT